MIRIQRFCPRTSKLATNREPQPRLLVAKSVARFIRESTAASPDTETGGILMGPPSPGPDVVVATHASGPGPAARREPDSFLRDTDHCRRVLRDHYERSRVDYVGEWHSHVVPLRRPSKGDLVTLVGIAMDPDYDFTAFGMIVALGGCSQQEPPTPVELLGFVATRIGVFQVPLEYVSEL